MATPLYVQTSFENGSAMHWEETGEGVLEIQPLYDHERGSHNRQLTHWHFRLRGTAGQAVCLHIPPSRNVYGGRRVNAFAKRIASQMSADGARWTPFFFELQADDSTEARIVLPANEVTIARIEPYTTRHLESLLERITGEPDVCVEPIGHTVEGRPLEMITLARDGGGKPGVLLRGRAHPWEAGGSWFIEGVIARALAERSILDAVDIHILPMAGKDGVVRGHTRFNLNGYDLNRGFVPGVPFDDEAVPENAALIRWTEEKARTKALPRFAVDLHDDDHGQLHMGDMERDAGFAERMRLLDEMMRRKTFYTEGMTAGAGSATFGEGMRNLFGIDGIVCELNSNWLAGAQAVPDSGIWKTYGGQFAEVLRDFAKAAYR